MNRRRLAETSWNGCLSNRACTATPVNKVVPLGSILLGSLLIMLSACGGGGGSQSQDLPPTPTPMYQLSLVFVGPGSGHVKVPSLAINCTSDCSSRVAGGTVVTLSLNPDHPSSFDRISGDPGCSDPSFTIAANMTCVVTFNPGPSLASVNGTQLMIQRRNLDGSLSPSVPYTMRGILWSPASSNTNTSPSDPNNANIRRPEFNKWYKTDVPLIGAMGANTVRLPLDLGFDGTLGPEGWRILSSLYAANIMVVMTVDDAVNDSTRIKAAVNYYKNHPAILMFSTGSEWNVNLYFGKASSVMQAAQFTQQSAKAIKSSDVNHPVATSYGDIDIDADGLRLSDTQNYVNNVCPAVDVWSVNIYRGDNFGLLFQQWSSIAAKPMFIGEFGIDAFHTANPNGSPPTGYVDEAEQSAWDLSLWNDLFRNLSASNSQKSAIGGTVFSWADEWWKVSPYDTQDTGGYLSGGFPDEFANEEYFGITDISRNPRQIYSTLQAAYSSQYNPGPQQLTFFADSAGILSTDPPAGFAEFDKNHTLLYHKTGEGGGGRGFNIAAIDPASGDLLSYPVAHFDTWSTRDSGSDMLNMVSFLNGLPNSTIILIAVADEAGLNDFPTQGNPCAFLPYPWVQEALQTLESLGSQQIGNYCYNDSWAMIAVKGEGTARSEQLSSSQEATAQSTFTVP
jgi:hypothetical protein